MRKIGIIGGGAMGVGIGQLIVRDDPTSTPVIIKEINEELAQKALRGIQGKIESWVERGKMPWDIADGKMNQVTVTTDYRGLADCDLLIEAVPEKMAIKKEVFAELDKAVKPEAIFASNTSALSITEIAAATKRPDKVAGMHFFNPPTHMPLLEVIPGKDTSEETLAVVEDYARNNIGRVLIRVKDSTGFLVNRVLAPYLNEAGFLLETTTLSQEEIDLKAREFGWPAGPFMLLDSVLGLGIAIEVSTTLHQAYGPRFEPTKIIDLLAKLGRYGEKSGAGFYIHDDSKDFEDLKAILKREFPKRKKLSLDEGFERMMLMLVNESIRCLEEGVASAADIENGAIFGVGFPDSKKGPLHYADQLGLDYVLQRLEEFQKKHGSRFEPANLLKEMVKQEKLGKKTRKGFFSYLFKK